MHGVRTNRKIKYGEVPTEFFGKKPVYQDEGTKKIKSMLPLEILFCNITALINHEINHFISEFNFCLY